MKYIYDLSLAELKDWVAEIGEKPFRTGQIFSALHNGTAVDGISNVPNTLKAKLHECFNCELPTAVQEQKSKDGTKKYLLQYADGDCVECVFLTQDYGNTICVSTQVGCRMGCAFCASGKDGLIRNLTAGEILAQVILVNKLNRAADTRAVTNIVLMGSGEPLDNFDAVMKFLELVTAADGLCICSPNGARHAPCGLCISGRNISLSTSGLVPQIKRFADVGGQVNLCISLHAPNDELRRQIMPIAKKYGVRELVDSAKYFFEKTHRRVIFEYSLMCRNGVPFNCTPEIGRELAALVRGFPAHINLINLNPLKFERGAELTPPDRKTAMEFITSDSELSAERQRSKMDAVEFTPATKEQAKIFMDSVIKAGASCTMRKNRGDDIDGACGQLRTKFVRSPR